MANRAGQSCRDYTPPGGETLEQVRLGSEHFISFPFGPASQQLRAGFHVQQCHARVQLGTSRQKLNTSLIDFFYSREISIILVLEKFKRVSLSPSR